MSILVADSNHVLSHPIPSSCPMSAPLHNNNNNNNNNNNKGDLRSSSSSSSSSSGSHLNINQDLFDQSTLITYVYCFVKNFVGTSSGVSSVVVDKKIEQAMVLLKSHLMLTVREEVEVLREKIAELMDRVSELEYENAILKANASQDTLTQIRGEQIQSKSAADVIHHHRLHHHCPATGNFNYNNNNC